MMLNRSLLGEMSVDHFIDEYLDRRPLVIKNASDLPAQFGLETVDEFLASCEGNMHMSVRVLLDAQDVTIQSNQGFSSETQKAFVDRMFQQGATIKVEKLETRHALISLLCAEFSQAFGGDTYAMTFLTPARHHGFPIHFDQVSSFIVQLSGKKHWKVYPEYISCPTKSMNRPMAGVDLPSPLFDVTLEPGDLLYMPAGFPHAAECSDSHSLHMTFGVTPHRPIDLLGFAMQAIMEKDLELRRPLRLAGPRSAATLSTANDHLIQALSSLDIDALIRQYRRSHNSTSADVFKYGLRNAARGFNATADTLVRGIKNKPYDIDVTDQTMTIHPSSTLRPGMPMFTETPCVKLPAIAETEVRAMMSAVEPQRIKDVPGQLDSESKLNVALRLSQFGLAELVDDIIAR